jgi:hypothetical protein
VSEDILKRLQACAIAGCSPPERALALEAAKEIARLREERRWISVEDRTPPVGETVCVIEEDGTRTLIGWIDPHHYCWTLGEELDSYATPNVTHWQPLPPGPEGDG